MLDQDALHQEVLRSNQAMRLWAEGLRARSRAARTVAQASRSATAEAMGRVPVPAVPVEPRPEDTEDGPRAVVDADLPSLGDVRVTELFTILVDQHGFGVVAAVRALAAGLMVAGYPADHDRVGAADAFEILAHALRDR